MRKRIIHNIASIFILTILGNTVMHAQTVLHVDSSLNVQVNSLVTIDVDGDSLQDIAGATAPEQLVWYKNLGDSIALVPFKFTVSDPITIDRKSVV